MLGKFLGVVESAPLLGPILLKAQERLFHRHAVHLRREAGEEYAAKVGNIVQRGIFAGMKLSPSLAWGADKFGMLSGQYEQELYPIIAQAAQSSYPSFIDIGCANGFYAVGFAMIAPACPVIAYDIDERARQMTARNAQLNGVTDRLEIHGLADHQELQSRITRSGSAFVLCDIEGAEVELLDPQACPALLQCDLLVELHGNTASVASLLTGRFAATHEIVPIGRSPRNPFDLDEDIRVPFENDAWMILSEGRGFFRYNWLYIKRK
jgi:hypothetical protein